MSDRNRLCNTLNFCVFSSLISGETRCWDGKLCRQSPAPKRIAPAQNFGFLFEIRQSCALLRASQCIRPLWALRIDEISSYSGIAKRNAYAIAARFSLSTKLSRGSRSSFQNRKHRLRLYFGHRSRYPIHAAIRKP